MATRFESLFHHASVKSSDSAELKAIKAEIMLQSLRAEFVISKAKLKQMALYMIHEMNIGLEKSLPTDPKQKPASTLKMLPSYVYRFPASAEGSFFALDLGGTNFRVMRMQICGGILQFISQRSYQIPVEHMRGTQEGLFGFIADNVKEFMENIGCETTETNAKLGFTFSFPVQQFSINKGVLLEWTKGFTAKNAVGGEVCEMLQKALDKKNVKLSTVALCNDTVGTLVTRYFSDSQTEIGVILGTGVNGCYWERSSKILKDPSLNKDDREMIINMEFGGFDSFYKHVLPLTTFDEMVDRNSLNPGSQIYEKMVSGMYMGEISRNIIVTLSKCGAISSDFKEQLEGKEYGFTAVDNGIIAADKLPGLHLVAEILKSHYGITHVSEHDRYVVREVCQLVGARSAQLGGMAIGATLLKTGKSSNATVAVDGSVYEKVPYYESILMGAIHDIVGTNVQVRVKLTKDGSGLGAGYIAALASCMNTL